MREESIGFEDRWDYILRLQHLIDNAGGVPADISLEARLDCLIKQRDGIIAKESPSGLGRMSLQQLGRDSWLRKVDDATVERVWLAVSGEAYRPGKVASLTFNGLRRALEAMEQEVALSPDEVRVLLYCIHEATRRFEDAPAPRPFDWRTLCQKANGAAQKLKAMWTVAL